MEIIGDNRNKSIKIFFFLLVLSFGFGNFYFNIGFSIKPYMIVFLLALPCLFGVIKFNRLRVNEQCLILFYIFYLSTFLQFRYPEENFRFIVLLTILLLFYLYWRGAIMKVSIKYIEESLSKAGLIICTASLLYYLLGLYSANFIMGSNGTQSYGVLFDRGYIRLCGTINEPNIAPFFMTIFFFYYLYHWNNLRNKIGFFLSLLIIFLSLSRGAILSVMTVFICVNIYYFNKKIWFKILPLFIVFIVICTKFVGSDNFNLVDTVISRFEDSADDNGSGRTIIWKYYFNNFSEHPIWGIGINSSRSHNILKYAEEHYAHNTYLEVLSESGIIGFTAFMLLIFSSFRIIYRIQKREPSARYLLASYISMVLQMFFLSLTYSEMFYFILLLIYRYNNETYFSPYKLMRK